RADGAPQIKASEFFSTEFFSTQKEPDSSEELEKLNFAIEAFQTRTCPRNAILLAMQNHIYLAKRLQAPVDLHFLRNMKVAAEGALAIEGGDIAALEKLRNAF